MFTGSDPESSGDEPDTCPSCNPAAIGRLHCVPLIRDESAASGCLDLGCASGMQTFAETTSPRMRNSLHYRRRATVFRLRPASFHAAKCI